jgi:hypothetical protein
MIHPTPTHSLSVFVVVVDPRDTLRLRKKAVVDICSPWIEADRIQQVCSTNKLTVLHKSSWCAPRALAVSGIPENR